MVLTGLSRRPHLWTYALTHYRGFPVPKFQSLASFLFDPAVSACAIAPIGLDFLLEEFRDIIGSVRRT
jgi:hypothetical protein